MKKKTYNFDLKEAAEKIKFLFKECDQYTYYSVQIKDYKEYNNHPKHDPSLHVTIHSGQELIPLTFSLLKKISDILSCEEINEIGIYRNEGCDTCGHGASYEIMLECWKFK